MVAFDTAYTVCWPHRRRKTPRNIVQDLMHSIPTVKTSICKFTWWHYGDIIHGWVAAEWLDGSAINHIAPLTRYSLSAMCKYPLSLIGWQRSYPHTRTHCDNDDNGPQASTNGGPLPSWGSFMSSRSVLPFGMRTVFNSLSNSLRIFNSTWRVSFEIEVTRRPAKMCMMRELAIRVTDWVHLALVKYYNCSNINRSSEQNVFIFNKLQSIRVTKRSIVWLEMLLINN